MCAVWRPFRRPFVYGSRLAIYSRAATDAAASGGVGSPHGTQYSGILPDAHPHDSRGLAIRHRLMPE